MYTYLVFFRLSTLLLSNFDCAGTAKWQWFRIEWILVNSLWWDQGLCMHVCIHTYIYIQLYIYTHIPTYIPTYKHAYLLFNFVQLWYSAIGKWFWIESRQLSFFVETKIWSSASQARQQTEYPLTNWLEYWALSQKLKLDGPSLSLSKQPTWRHYRNRFTHGFDGIHICCFHFTSWLTECPSEDQVKNLNSHIQMYLQIYICISHVVAPICDHAIRIFKIMRDSKDPCSCLMAHLL